MLWDPWEGHGWMEGNEGGFWVKGLTAVFWETKKLDSRVMREALVRRKYSKAWACGSTVERDSKKLQVVHCGWPSVGGCVARDESSEIHKGP